MIDVWADDRATAERRSHRATAEKRSHHRPALVLGIVLALVLVMVGFGFVLSRAAAEPDSPGATENGSVQRQANIQLSTAMMRECEGETPDCNRAQAKRFKRQYRAGRFGKVRGRAQIDYSRHFRKDFMRTAGRKWNRTHRSNFDRSEAWHGFVRHDTCFSPKVWPMRDPNCKPGHASEAFKTGVKRVLFCGAAALPVTASGPWVFYAFGLCQVGFFVK